ncbi:acetylornithine deacetylase [Staphylococcus debuckii]|uniref:acetylornithine deacetylase n=1 Tax=Staphylococcus debuckii TaxID=2044912 RepID=UPI000F435A1E|nr:acetylornithine deacetylase [Staphylococcus debuckii]AYU56064.1 acetylornithine deacetylase [Staphylococcus debuckii]
MNKRHFDLLKLLVEYNTESPPARNTDPLQDEIQAFLEENGFEVQRRKMYDHDSIVVGVLKGKDPRAPKLILNGHVDVANVEDPKYWTYPPFELTEVDDWLYGRGVSDMKGGVASLFYVLERLRKEGVEPEGDIIVQSVVGEEVGEAGTKYACEMSPEADLALVMDTSDNQALGQGGVITGWITVQSKETVHDGARSQMVHAGGGLYGASAIEKMAKIITALKELEQHWAVMKSYPDMPAGANTINPAVIEGGRNPAFIADECRLWVTVHFLPDEDYHEVVEEIEAYLNRVAEADVWLRENPLQFDWGGTSMIEDRGEVFPSFTLPLEHLGYKMLEAAHEAVYDEQLVSGMTTTVTDGGWLADAGVPTILYGPGSLTEAHSVDEKVKKEELAHYSEVLYKFLKSWYAKPEKE